jgi:hypothetical protein
VEPSDARAVDRLIDVPGDARALLMFESHLPPSSWIATVEVRVAGSSWITAGAVPASDDWQPVVLDLTAVAGRTVHVRFRLQSPDGVEAGEPPAWRIGRLRIEKDR